MEQEPKNSKKKFRLEGSKACAICLENVTEGVLLHKTQRQTHMLCLNCAESFIVSQLRENLTQKNYVHTISCCSVFGGNKRNTCKKILNVTELKIPASIETIPTLVAKITAFTMPGATACLSGICENVVLIPENTDIAICPDCQLTWCHRCKVSPFHVRMTCVQHKFINDSTPETQQMKQLIAEGEIKLCPTCNHGIEKNRGCNKVTCSQCKNAMCWLCGAGKIDYNHFDNGTCFDKLHRT